VLGRYAYTALDGGSMESRVALANPFDAGMTLDGDFLACPGLEHVITDTHFSARGRLGRLIAFVARINRDDPAANIRGIGVDEASALLIDEKSIGRLAPGSKGNAWIVEETESTRNRIEAGSRCRSTCALRKSMRARLSTSRMERSLMRRASTRSHFAPAASSPATNSCRCSRAARRRRTKTDAQSPMCASAATGSAAPARTDASSSGRSA